MRFGAALFPFFPAEFLPECITEVSDSGTGMPEEVRAHLFEPFFTTKSSKGTGLGLWITKGIIQKYEGTVRFRSILFNGGNITSFRVILPGAVPGEKGNAGTNHAAGNETASVPPGRA